MQVNEVTVAGVGQFTDTLITDFGGLATWAGFGGLNTSCIRPVIFWLSFDSAGAAHNLRLFLAQGAAATEDNLTPLVDTAILGTTLNHYSLSGGRGGCMQTWLDAGAGGPWQLRATTTGKAGTGTCRVGWAWSNVE